MKKFHILVREVVKFGSCTGHTGSKGMLSKEELCRDVQLEMRISVWFNHKPLPQ